MPIQAFFGDRREGLGSWEGWAAPSAPPRSQSLRDGLQACSVRPFRSGHTQRRRAVGSPFTMVQVKAQAPIGVEVFERHTAGRESLLEMPADFLTRKLRQPVEC